MIYLCPFNIFNSLSEIARAKKLMYKYISVSAAFTYDLLGGKGVVAHSLTYQTLLIPIMLIN